MLIISADADTIESCDAGWNMSENVLGLKSQSESRPTYIKTDDTSPLPSTEQKLSQIVIPDTHLHSKPKTGW